MKTDTHTLISMEFLYGNPYDYQRLQREELPALCKSKQPVHLGLEAQARNQVSKTRLSQR